MSDNLALVLIIAMCFSVCLATCNGPNGTDLVDRILVDKECVK